MIETAVVVVTYNRKEMLYQNLSALQEQKNALLDIFVIDNASTDGTKEMIDKYFEEIHYVNTGKNIGGAGGFQRGLKEVMQHNYRYAWLMDDDTIPSETALNSLLNKAKLLNDKFSYLCSLVKFTDDSLCEMNIPLVHDDALREYQYCKDNLVRTKYCSFVSCFVNLDVAKQTGLPVTEFFIYGDDVEYTYRLGKLRKGFWDIDSVVTHKMMKNESVDIEHVAKEKIERIFYENRNWFYIARRMGGKEVIKYIYRNMEKVFKIMKYAKDYKLLRIWVLVKSFFAGLVFNPKVQKYEK